MNAYTIKPGNIAAVCHVITPEGVEHDCIYIAPDKPIEVGIDGSAPFFALPLGVQDAVVKHFGTIFALPLERRGWYLQACAPWQVNGQGAST